MRPAWLALLLAMGCEDELLCPAPEIASDLECATSEDCTELPGLSCVDGVCKLPCVRDSDCVLPAPDVDRCRDTPEQPLTICEDQLCVEGCTSAVECAPGERCAAGRCGFYVEGFEARQQGEFVTLDRLSFDLIGKELENTESAVVSDDSEQCRLGGGCPGVASEGIRWALLGTVAAPERGTPELGPTCRACACCLDCLAEPLAGGSTLACARAFETPQLLECPATIPPSCEDACTACDACPPADRPLGERMLPCEAKVAARTCSSCVGCARGDCTDCRAALCPSECLSLSSSACYACETERCPACADCRACECGADPAGCALPGADGCFPAPVNYPRQELTDLEQSLVSPAIDLSAAIEPLKIQLDVIPFDVGDTYRPAIQGTPRPEWPERAQEIVLSFCGARCEEESSWIEAARLPASSQRNNGLIPGAQQHIDWTIGRFEVPIPDALRTSEFRFRVLPRLGSASAAGIDEVRIRRNIISSEVSRR